MADTTTSTVTFSILSPDASLAHDRIKLRLKEYRALLASDSDTIELSTEDGKTVICRKQAKETEEYLDQAENLLRDVVQSRDISTLVVLHQLRDLAKVLDNLKLYDECRLTGNCALDLAEALGRRSLEFRQEQAETLTVVAELSVYEPRARTLLIQAVSISEEVVANDASHSNKYKLLSVLKTASYLTRYYLGTEWLDRAVQLMTKELPPTMVDPTVRSMIHFNHGNCLHRFKQYDNAMEAYHESISICRVLADDDPAKYNPTLAETLTNMGKLLDEIGQYYDAIAAYKEVQDICTVMSPQDPLQYNELMARSLFSYGFTLNKLKKVSEAAVVLKQAVSLYRDLAQTEHGWTALLCSTLYNYGDSLYSLGRHAEAVLAYQESILLRRDRAATDPKEEKYLMRSLHNISNSFNALGKSVEANAAAVEALERNHGKEFGGCMLAPGCKSCVVCQRAITPDSPPNHSPSLPFLLANSSSRPAEDHRADASPTPDETPMLAGETVNVPVHKRRQKVLGLFRRDRAQ